MNVCKAAAFGGLFVMQRQRTLTGSIAGLCRGRICACVPTSPDRHNPWAWGVGVERWKQQHPLPNLPHQRHPLLPGETLGRGPYNSTLRLGGVPGYCCFWNRLWGRCHEHRGNLSSHCPTALRGAEVRGACPQGGLHRPPPSAPPRHHPGHYPWGPVQLTEREVATRLTSTGHRR